MIHLRMYRSVFLNLRCIMNRFISFFVFLRYVFSCTLSCPLNSNVFSSCSISPWVVPKNPMYPELSQKPRCITSCPINSNVSWAVPKALMYPELSQKPQCFPSCLISSDISWVVPRAQMYPEFPPKLRCILSFSKALIYPWFSPKKARPVASWIVS